MIEAFSFDKGMNRKKSPLLLSDGECYTCSEFSFDHDGVLECRNAKTQSNAIDTAGTSAINGIHRYIDSVLASSKKYCPGNQVLFNYIYQRDKDASAFTNIDILANNTRPRFGDYEKFIFAVDGESKRAYIDANIYDWGVANPQVAPSVLDSGVAGNPDGEYNCYYTYYVTFPNGKSYETGPSPVGTVTVATRKLYRTVSGSAYLVKTITDNTTTTYTDDVTDTALAAASALGTTGYSTPPDGATDIAIYLQRVFLIKANTLYWSEVYQPFAFKSTSNVVVTKEDEDLVSILDWGDQIYLVTKERWYRLQGNDPDTWAIKRTFTDRGVINRHTVKRSKFGILGLDYDGIALFDGSVTLNLTEKKLGKAF
ncbi:MAG: hypothetical protein ACW99U_22025, partial [Candidatus Thorarchaeota archaeon]